MLVSRPVVEFSANEIVGKGYDATGQDSC